jgi:effector-binding domain-containing protein/carbon monoxide dehydrogenase subunit G
MKFLKILLYIVIALFAIFIAVNAFLPSQVHVEKSIDISAQPLDIFEQVNNFKNWKKWSPWLAIDPDMEIEYNEVKAGVGAEMSWNSKDRSVGIGSQKIIESAQNKLIITEITFAGSDPINANFTFTQKGENLTTVKWTMDSEMGFFTRWFGLLIKPKVEDSYEDGLNRLKEVVDARPPQPENITFSVGIQDNIDYLFLRYNMNTTSPEMKGIFGYALAQIKALIKEKNLVETGPFLTLTNRIDEQNNMWDFNIGIPVGMAGIKFPGDVETGRIPRTRALRTIAKGSLLKMEQNYAAIMLYIAYNGFEIGGPNWMSYLTNPNLENQEEVTVEINYPIF